MGINKGFLDEYIDAFRKANPNLGNEIRNTSTKSAYMGSSLLGSGVGAIAGGLADLTFGDDWSPWQGIFSGAAMGAGAASAGMYAFRKAGSNVSTTTQKANKAI